MLNTGRPKKVVRECQQEIPPQKMAEILREYADRLDE